jgi:hypothetical protein
MPHPPHPSILDASVRAAWQTQLAAAVNTPSLLPALMHRQSELLPSFAAYYTQLRALPRRVRRALQRQWRLPLAGVALLLALEQQPVQAATISVGGSCTLVNAITAANTDMATGGCPAGSGADTIVLPASSTQTLTEGNNSTYGATGLPVISSVITIAGQGSTIVRDSGAPAFRIVAVNSTGDLTLQETTVSGGIAPALSPYDVRNGGGVANYGGTLTVLNSTISGNATAYCPNYCYGGSGGGIANGGGTLTVLNSTISGNSALLDGGGVANFDGGTLTVVDSTITGNSAIYSNGGGVANGGGICTVLNSIISGNFAGGNDGGGVANFAGGTLTVVHSTIADNDAYGYFSGSGGGVANYGGTVTMTNSIIAGNGALNGGGIINAGIFTILNSTIADNRASAACNLGGCFSGSGGVANFGTLTILNSTITGNRAPGSGGGADNSGILTILNSTSQVIPLPSPVAVWRTASVPSA